MMTLNNFFMKYYVYPLTHPHTEVYNIYNTLTYGLILAVMVFAVYKLLTKMNVKVDKNFFFAVTPFIAVASLLRVLRDADILTSNVLVSPLIYIVTFFVTLLVLTICLIVDKYSNHEVPYYTPMSLTGISIFLAFFVNYRLESTFPGLMIFGLAFIISGAFVMYSKYFKGTLLSNMNLGILSASLLDASSTFVGVQYYGYIEKHVVPNYLIQHLGAWVMFPLKIVVILLALYLIDSTEESENFKNFIKFAILTVTLGPGLRNVLRLMMGV